MNEDDANVISIKRAKIAWQLKRNACLRKAVDVLKKDDKAKSENVFVDWLVEDTKHREIKIGSAVAFRQKIDDVSGSFLPPFAHLSVPA